MSIKVAMKQVESHEFAARLNLASDLRTFFVAAQREEAIRVLLRYLESPQTIKSLFFRTLELSRQRVDPRYENPWDTALAVYLWLINLKDFNLSKLAAEAVSQSTQCWWVRKVSTDILCEVPVHNDASISLLELDLPSTTLPSTIQSSDGGEVILPASFIPTITMTLVQANNSNPFSSQKSTFATPKAPKFLNYSLLTQNIAISEKRLTL